MLEFSKETYLVIRKLFLRQFFSQSRNQDSIVKLLQFLDTRLSTILTNIILREKEVAGQVPISYSLFIMKGN